MMPHQYRVKIFYEDTDAVGVVYHANFLRYLDRARSEWLVEMGYELQMLRKTGILFAIRHVELEYMKPAQLGDQLIIETLPQQIRRVSFTCDHTIRSEQQPELIYAIATVQIASVNQHLKPCRMPQGLIEEMQNSGESIVA